MKLFVTILLIFMTVDPIGIARVNKIKKEAEKAYNTGNYQTAAEKYQLLTDSMRVNEDEVYLNLGHSYYQLKDTLKAKNSYTQISSSPNKSIRSVALQQLGVMAREKMALEESLQYLKSSLKANPMNEESRYNYEVVKKLLESQEQQNQDNQDQEDNKENQDENKENQEQQDNKDQGEQDKNEQEQSEEEQQQDQQDQEGEEGDQQEEQQPEDGEQEKEEREQQESGAKEKMEEMNISEEKAQMILEAMKNNEFQYIQQRKRKPTKPQDSGKPDW